LESGRSSLSPAARFDLYEVGDSEIFSRVEFESSFLEGASVAESASRAFVRPVGDRGDSYWGCGPDRVEIHHGFGSAQHTSSL